MSKDGFMPPGATENQRREHYDGPRFPKTLRCIGCMKDKPAEEVDEEGLCEECRRDRVNEDAGEER